MLTAMHPFVAILVLAAATVLPKSAVIVDSTEDAGGFPIGNVKVTFSDGHAELWTKTGKAQQPKVAANGMVGWARYEVRYEKMPVLDTIRIVWPDEHHKDYKTEARHPFIEEWAFADDDTALIIKSRAVHGAATFIKYEIATRKILGRVSAEEKLPDWAKPFADD